MTVVIEVNGGLVQVVRSDTPNIEVIVVDWDVIDVSDPPFRQKIASQALNAEGDVDEDRFPHVLY